MICDLTAGKGTISKIPYDETIAQLDDVAVPVMATVNNQANRMNPAMNTQERPDVNRNSLNFNDQIPTPVETLPYESMTNFLSPSRFSSDSNGKAIASTSSNLTPTSAASDSPTDPPNTGASPASIGGFTAEPPDIFQDTPQFSVPNNPLLPPGYQEVLDYGSLQYLNGFLRTQIGRYVRVEYIVGSSMIEEMLGYLVGVGINYLLLQEISTNNVIAMDFYTVKSVYFYYSKTDLPTNSTK